MNTKRISIEYLKKNGLITYVFKIPYFYQVFLSSLCVYVILVTQKVYESESYSEDSDHESKCKNKEQGSMISTNKGISKESENPKAKTQQTTTTATKKKAKTQSNLSSFFKKL